MNKNKYLAGYMAAVALGGAYTACAQTTSTSSGQAYPAKPVRFLIAFTPGGPSDILTRLVGGKLAESMGQPFIFDNRPGAGGNIAGELFQSMTGTKMVHIPYKGAGPALIDTLAGQCQLMFATSLSVVSYIRSDKVRALAVSTGKRSQSFPNLPTVAEAGVPGFEATTWHGVVAPAGTPAAIIGRLNSEINKLLQAREMRERLTSQGAEIIGGTPQEFAAYIQREIPKWTKVIKDSGARAE